MRHLERGILLFLGGSVLTVRGMIGSIDHHLKHSEIYFVSGIVVAAGGLTFITISLLPKKYLLRNAVDVYNQNIPKVGMENTIQIGKTTNGIGFVYNFG